MGTVSDILKAIDHLSAKDLQELMEKLEDKRDLELLTATRKEERVPFSEYLVEWLMNYPAGASNLKPSEMDKIRL